MFSLSSRSVRLFVWLLAATGGCATAQQPVASRPSNGVTLVLKDDAKCSTSGAVEGAMPNDQLCHEVVSSLRSDLTQAGFTVTGDSASPGALTLAIGAVQSASQSPQTADLAVEVRVKRGGGELEVFSEVGEVTRDSTHGQLASVLHALAADVAGSKQIQGTASADKTGGSAAAL